MTETARERWRIGCATLFVSTAAWVLLGLNPGRERMELCSLPGAAGPYTSLRLWFAANPPAAVAGGWAVMLTAMMAPTLVAPLHHVLTRSFRRRRLEMGAVFLAGYVATWMAAGAIGLTLGVALKRLLPDSSLFLAAAAVMAGIWQCSPLKQRCLNRCHQHRELRAFGPAATLNAFRFGITHGCWCVGACWALMLLSHGAAAVLLAVTALIIGERLDRPQPPRWQLRCSATFVRLLLGLTLGQIRSAAAGYRARLQVGRLHP